MADDEKEIKRKKQVKRMTKIISKAWSIPNSEPFQEWTKHPSQPGEPLDLTSVGRALDNGRYPHGRSGWETFANDIGGVYTWHILRYDIRIIQYIIYIDIHFCPLALGPLLRASPERAKGDANKEATEMFEWSISVLSIAETDDI
jgi:hypothetical protein